MKLSKKGKDRLYGSHNVFYDDDIEGDVVALYELSEVWEFDPDDFQGMVCLTVYEAKILATALGYLNGWCKEIYMHDINKLKKRIEKIDQAEGK